MRMVFSIPVPKPLPQIQNTRAVRSTTNPTSTNESLVISYSFNNIFSRLRTSGKCTSCGN